LTSPRIAILISGRGSNMEAIIRASQDGILRNRCTLCGVLANRPDAFGLRRANKLGLPTRMVASKGLGTLAYGRHLLEALSDWAPDFIVLAGFMRILSPEVVAAYRGRIVNIHPADTTLYQGPDGYGWAADNALTQTTISVHLIDEGVDTGPLLQQASVSLVGATTKDEIAQRGLQVEHAIYSQCLANLFDGQYASIIAENQNQLRGN
jgi:phosphoribosylglycinamide formyltransferase 1